jgi:hypothetical protein
VQQIALHLHLHGDITGQQPINLIRVRHGQPSLIRSA